MNTTDKKRLPALARYLILISAVGLLVICFCLTLAQTVVYKPYGVPDSRREEYDEAIRKIALRNKLLKESDQEKRPIAVVNNRVHDFGLLDPHTTMTHSFVVRNDGKDPLALEVLGTSCKCTTGKSADGLLKQNESTEVTLTWNTGYQDESYTQSAILRTNDPNNLEIKLVVKGTVRTKMSAPVEVVLPSQELLEPSSTSFLVHSQLWEEFRVSDVRSKDLRDFSWFAEPVSTSDARLADAQARSAWEVTVEAVGYDYGSFKGNIVVDIESPDADEKISKDVAVAGKVREPIVFKSPLLHSETGLDLGTLNSGVAHEFPVSVEVRGDKERELVVLSVEPKELRASLTQTKRSNVYRLLIRVPEDCPFVLFNRPDQHGYVEVGDPNDPNCRNWFPIYGGVVDVD